MNEVCTSYGSTPSVYLSAPVIHRIVSKSYTLKTRPSIAPRSRSQLESEFMIVFLSRAKPALNFALPMHCKDNSKYKFRFDDRTSLNRY